MSYKAPILKVEEIRTGEDVELKFSGFLDETSVLPNLDPEPMGELRINLESLVGINSLGCRKWALWIKDKTGAGLGASLLNCGPAVINQINVLSGFIPPHERVASIYAPYACTVCKATEHVLLKNGVEFNEDGIIALDEHRICPKCGGTMELDVMRERYFQFVKRSR